jgi:hypothetical protein
MFTIEDSIPKVLQQALVLVMNKEEHLMLIE